MMRTLDRTTAIGTALTVIILAVVWTQPARRSHAPAYGAASLRADTHPVAALAWAQANCNPSLTLKPGTPRTQSDILYEVAAALDAERSRRGLRSVCDEAIAASRDVSVILDAPALSTARGGYETATNAAVK